MAELSNVELPYPEYDAKNLFVRDALGLLNDSECKVTLFLDNDFMNGSELIGVHPNDNTATVWLKVKDLMKIIQKHGNTVNVVRM